MAPTISSYQRVNTYEDKQCIYPYMGYNTHQSRRHCGWHIIFIVIMENPGKKTALDISIFKPAHHNCRRVILGIERALCRDNSQKTLQTDHVSGNGLAPNRWQTLTCTNDHAPWCHILSLGHNELIHFNQNILVYKCQHRAGKKMTLKRLWKFLEVTKSSYHISIKIILLCKRFADMFQWTLTLTHCGLVTLYGDWFGSTLVQVMICCLMAPSHYQNQCWLLLVKFCGILLRVILHQVPKPLSCVMILKSIFLKSLPHLSEAMD